MGTIPEPSSEKVDTFLAVLREILPVGTDAEGNSTIDLAAIAAEFEGREDEIEPILDAAIAAVCSDQPNAEQIKALPYRAKQAFYGWILESLLSPSH